MGAIQDKDKIKCLNNYKLSREHPTQLSSQRKTFIPQRNDLKLPDSTNKDSFPKSQRKEEKKRNGKCCGFNKNLTT